MNTMTFKDLQDQQVAWVQHNFPGRTFEEPFKGMVEELGELSHSLLKQKQGIRGTCEEQGRCNGIIKVAREALDGKAAL